MLKIAIFAWMIFGVSPAISQRILPSRYLPGDTTIGLAAGEQNSPAISRGGNQFLVVWADYRAKVTAEPATGSDIYGIRLDSNGNPIEQVPFLIAQGYSDDTSPKVAWNGQNWLVGFETYGPSPTGYYAKYLGAVRVSPGGQVLDAKPIVVVRELPGWGWALTSDGQNWAFAAQGNDVDNGIFGIRISPAGEVLNVPGVLLVPSTYYMRSGVAGRLPG
jgi:hypothetical protein